MPLSRFDKFLPWTGLIAGLCWIGHWLLDRTSETDVPGAATASVINDNLLLNRGNQACLVLMGIALLFFATAVRNLLRAGEAREGTYSNIAFAGWIVVVAGISQMVTWGWALVNGAADAGDDAAVHVLSYGHYFSWAANGIGLATALIAFGLGGIRNAVLPKWFAIVSIVLGVLGGLGNAGIPPGGLVNYLLLPFWLATAAIVVAKRQKRASSTAPVLASA